MQNIIDKIGIIDSKIILEQEVASLNIFHEFYNDTKYKNNFKQKSTFINVDLGYRLKIVFNHNQDFTIKK